MASLADHQGGKGYGRSIEVLCDGQTLVTRLKLMVYKRQTAGSPSRPL
jgi:hypothetical protein